VIVEGLCTTRNPDDSTNIAPMGPVVDAGLTEFRFRPFRTSTTFQNLQSTGYGVFHITDDVRMIAEAAVGHLQLLPVLQPALKIPGRVIASACRWYEFEVVSIDDSDERTEIATRILHTGHLRDYFGLNRAKHACVEAAILATRTHLLPASEIEAELQRLAVLVTKTGGEAEQAAFDFLRTTIAQAGQSR